MNVKKTEFISYVTGLIRGELQANLKEKDAPELEYALDARCRIFKALNHYCRRIQQIQEEPHESSSVGIGLGN